MEPITTSRPKHSSKKKVRKSSRKKKVRNPYGPFNKSNVVPDGVIASIVDITQMEVTDAEKFLESSIKARQVTNDHEDIKEWVDGLSKKVVKVVETENEFKDILISAGKTIKNQVDCGIGGKKRSKSAMMADKVFGYLGEYAVKKFAIKNGIHVDLAHGIGNPKDFFKRDIAEVYENGLARLPKKDIGIKANGFGSVWGDVPKSQFVRSDYHIFCKNLVSVAYVADLFGLSGFDHDPYFANNGFNINEHLEKSNVFRPIYVYLVGFVDKNLIDEQAFEYEGSMAKKVFTVNKVNCVVPKNYEEIIRKKSRLLKKTTIQFDTITKFRRLESGGLFVSNLGNIEKPMEEVVELLRKL